MSVTVKLIARSGRGTTWKVCSYNKQSEAELHRSHAQRWAQEHEQSCIACGCTPENPYDAAYDHEEGPVKYEVVPA